MPADTLSSLTSLAQYGMVGVIIALILLCAFVMWLYSKLSVKHIEKSNEVFTEVAKALVENVGVTRQLEATVKDLKQTINNR